MYVCIMDHEGQIHLHRNMPAASQALAGALQSYLHDLVLTARVHLHPILGCRSVQPHRRRVRSGPCPVHEGDSWWKGEKRHDRFPENRRLAAKRHVPYGLRVPTANAIERQITAQVPEHDPVAVHLLRSIPGVGKVLALVIFYEIQDIIRFPRVGNFISYARLMKCSHESAGKRTTGKTQTSEASA
jgi:hypothetical protein